MAPTARLLTLVSLCVGVTACSGGGAATAPTTTVDASAGEAAVVECVQSLPGFTCPPGVSSSVSTECTRENVRAWVDAKCEKAPCGGAPDPCQQCLSAWTRRAADGSGPEVNLEPCLRRFVPVLRGCVDAQACLDACVAAACATCPDDPSRDTCAERAKAGTCKGRAEALVTLKCETELASPNLCNSGDLASVLDLACHLRGVEDAGVDVGPTPDTSTGGVTDSAPDTPPSIKLGGAVKGVSGEPIAGAKLTTLEDPTITATSDATGTYALRLPTDVPLTVTVTATGYARTIEQTAKFSMDFGLDPIMATTSQYLSMQAAGGAPKDTALLYVISYSTAPCNQDGATVAITPSAGKVIYGGADGLPGAATAMLVANPPIAYVTGVPATGTVELTVTPKAGCKMSPWPVDIGAAKLLGPIKLMPDAFLDLSAFIAP